MGVAIGTLMGSEAKLALSLIRPRLDMFPLGVALPERSVYKIRAYLKARIYIEKNDSAFLTIAVDDEDGLNFFVCYTSQDHNPSLHVHSAVFTEERADRQEDLLQAVRSWALEEMGFSQFRAHVD